MNLKLAIGVLILVLATCSIYSPTPRGSGIEGQVLLGPMCPVVQQGQECPDQPYQTTLTVNSLKESRSCSSNPTRRALGPLCGKYIPSQSPNGIPFAVTNPLPRQVSTHS
jgi:hypothetical protein